MPRNGSGTFSVETPILVGALRSSSVVNADFTDIGDEITNSLPIDGQAGMSGQFKAATPLSGAPGISWADDTNTGFKRTGVDKMAWMGGGQVRAEVDENGKLTLAAGLDVTGAFSHTTTFNPQTLAGIDAARATLRNTTNDANEHVLAKYQSGSGAGASGELRMVGGAANDVATMRFYVNDVLAFQWTSALFTHSIDTLFGASGIRGDADGFLDFPELSAAPSAPASNIARLYSRDNGSGATQLYYKDGSGTESNFQPPTDRQVFTSSSTWTKPTTGQTQAMIEVWSGGGSGGKDTNAGAGGGGGGAYSRCVIAIASLSASVAVTIGSGGAARSTDGIQGAVGGNSSFGTYLSTFGGGGGGWNTGGGENAGGGGGGGFLSVGTVGGNDAPTSGPGGTPRGVLGAETWGAGSTVPNCNAFGGGEGGIAPLVGQVSVFGGAGGGGGSDGVGSGRSAGGASIYGGGGGGGSNDNDGSASGGTSVFGGSGGASAVSSSAATDGTAPAGGGGSQSGSGNSGAGARGEIRVTCW